VPGAVHNQPRIAPNRAAHGLSGRAGASRAGVFVHSSHLLHPVRWYERDGEWQIADINDDGVVNAVDVQLVINVALGIEINP